MWLSHLPESKTCNIKASIKQIRTNSETLDIFPQCLMQFYKMTGGLTFDRTSLCSHNTKVLFLAVKDFGWAEWVNVTSSLQ